jgi:hypothetical protein
MGIMEQEVGELLLGELLVKTERQPYFKAEVNIFLK